MKVALVAGTHGYRGLQAPDQWWWPTSPLAQMLEDEGHEIVGLERPFVWTTNVNGIGGKVHHVDWRCGGESFYTYCVPPLCPDQRVRPTDLAVVCHSHGLQPVLYAAEAGLKIECLISVSSPVRKDMADVARAARPNIKRWRRAISPTTTAPR
jgi:hypothetical protein